MPHYWHFYKKTPEPGARATAAVSVAEPVTRRRNELLYSELPITNEDHDAELTSKYLEDPQ
jgi:hypothetical protein